MNPTKMFQEVEHKVTGIVREIHHKSGPTWSRFKIQLETGNHVWCVCKWPVEMGEVICAKGVFSLQYKSYDLTEVVHDGEAIVSNEVVILKLCENLKGVGLVKAGKLGEKFPNLFDAVVNRPEEVVKECGARLEDVVLIGEQLTAQRETLGRLTILKKAHWPDAIAKRIITSDTLYRIAIKSPYAAIRWVDGLGWLIADEIGRKQGIAMDAPERLVAGIDHVYRTQVTDNGHTKAPRDFLNHELQHILGVPEAKFRNTLSMELIPIADGWMCTRRNREHAQSIADFFCK